MGIIRTFYEALQKLDYQTMQNCYHPEATFSDPVFGTLQIEEAQAMWQMLCQNARDFSLEYQVVEEGEKGSCDWTAAYTFSQTKRKVVNHGHSRFVLKDGKIFTQRDEFSLWRWSRQALGIPGLLLGWIPPFQTKIRQFARERLAAYRSKLEGNDK